MHHTQSVCLCLLLLFSIRMSAVDVGQKIVDAAKTQIGKTTSYDSSYRSLSYPNGDPPIEVGVCTDVVVRALRKGMSIDLQKQVHEDMKQNFSVYPPNWGLSRPDKNIDHRRVPNLKAYFERKGYRLNINTNVASFLPGDIVTCTVARKLPHIMIVSDRKTDKGVPLIIHNIGFGTEEDDRLYWFPLTGHYRLSDTPERVAPPSNNAVRIYQVGSRNDGGTLSGIAKLFYGKSSQWRRIHEANRDLIPNPDVIRKGMTLTIPD